MRRIPAALALVVLTTGAFAQTPAPAPGTPSSPESKKAEAASPAPVPPAPPAPPVPAPAAAPKPDQAPKVESSPVAPAPKFSPLMQEALGPQSAGKAKVVFFRPSKMVGALIRFVVREGEGELGKLRNGKFFVADLPPGKHTFTVHSEAKDNTIIELEAGETYFISGYLTMGFLVGRPHLKVADMAAFEEALPKLERAALHVPAPKEPAAE